MTWNSIICVEIFFLANHESFVQPASFILIKQDGKECNQILSGFNTEAKLTHTWSVTFFFLRNRRGLTCTGYVLYFKRNKCLHTISRNKERNKEKQTSYTLLSIHCCIRPGKFLFALMITKANSFLKSLRQFSKVGGIFLKMRSFLAIHILQHIIIMICMKKETLSWVLRLWRDWIGSCGEDIWRWRNNNDLPHCLSDEQKKVWNSQNFC